MNPGTVPPSIGATAQDATEALIAFKELILKGFDDHLYNTDFNPPGYYSEDWAMEGPIHPCRTGVFWTQVDAHFQWIRAPTTEIIAKMGAVIWIHGTMAAGRTLSRFDPGCPRKCFNRESDPMKCIHLEIRDASK